MSKGPGDHCNPAVALDSRGVLYAAWQENERGVWRVRMSMSADGLLWSEPIAVADSNDNQVNPVLAAGVLPTGLVALAWQGDAAGNQDIYVATLTDDGVTVEQVTSDPADQTEPALAVDGNDTVVVLWADARNGSSDIYGAASADGAWTNVPVVNMDSNQSQIAVAASRTGDTLHVAWVDDLAGDLDVFYAASEGLPLSPVAGVDLIDDASGADQRAPVLVVAPNIDGAEQVFACWADWRNGDADLYLADVSAGSPRANVLVEGDGLEGNQYEPVLGVSECGDAYMAWTDDAGGLRRVYCSPVPAPAAQPSAVEADCGLEALDPS